MTDNRHGKKYLAYGMYMLSLLIFGTNGILSRPKKGIFLYPFKNVLRSYQIAKVSLRIPRSYSRSSKKISAIFSIYLMKNMA